VPPLAASFAPPLAKRLAVWKSGILKVVDPSPIPYSVAIIQELFYY